MASHEGKYRINAVAEMTGIPAATLRAWERRYGVPEPRRTQSSYRVYSDADIQLVRRVRALCDQGLAPSEAAKMVLAEDEPVPETGGDSVDPYKRAIESILQSVTEFDPTKLEMAVTQAMAMGSATSIFERIFRPAMVEIGQRWHDGVYGVGQEHMATEVLEAATMSMLRLVQREDTERTAVVACFADETHSMASNGFGLHLASWGFGVVRMGGRTPPHAIRQAVEELSPSLIALSVTIKPSGHRTRELVEEYAAAAGETPWLVGGRSAHELSDLVTLHGGAVVTDGDPRSWRGIVESLVASNRKRGRKRR